MPQGTNPNIDLFALFMLLGMGQGLFLATVFLLKKSHRNKSNTYLGLLFFIISLTILEIFLNYSGYILNVIYLFSFSNSLYFLIGPLLYIYLSISLVGVARFKWLHFIPFLVYFIYYLFHFNLQGDALKLNAYINWYDLDIPIEKDVHIIKYWFFNSLRIQKYYIPAVLFHYCAYIVASIILLSKNITRRGSSFFRLKDIRLKWLRNIVLGFLFLIIIAIYLSITIKNGTYNYLSSTILSGLMYYVSFIYIAHSSFFSSREFIGEDGQKYARSTLSAKDKEELLSRIKVVMDNEKLYQNNHFSLPLLAKRVGSSTNYVSQTINECMNQNFYDFLATYRINEAKRLLLSGETEENITIEELGFRVGYNSKAAFNSAFKKITGLTPSAFRSNQSD